MLVCNINAVDVNGSIHKEKTKTELTPLQADATLVLNSDFVYLRMEKSKVFTTHVLGESFTYGLDFGKGNSKSVSIPYEDILKQINPNDYKNSIQGNFNNERNALDKIIDKIPEDVFLDSENHPFQFYMNKKEFNKIESLLDKNNKYKGLTVVVLEKSPKDLIFLRRKQSSRFF